MGMVAQVDAPFGGVLDVSERAGRMRDMLIVFTADHCEFRGDRGLGENELFYDEVVCAPFVVADPDPRADATRGRAEARMIEVIDVLRPCSMRSAWQGPRIASKAGPYCAHARRGAGDLGDAVFCELDNSFRFARRVLVQVRAQMHARFFDWMADQKRRPTVSDVLVAARTDAHRGDGVHIGIW